MSAETHTFRAETQKLLDLMVHSLYSHKEVFLRELVSNASDALDKLRFEGLQNAEWLPAEELGIQLRADARDRTLVVEDNGIGMTHDELIDNLGTIARSGSLEFLNQQQAESPDAPELIGQFGVGFYASFMVADEVRVLSRKAGHEEAWLWVSKGDDRFEISPAERATAGTTITLLLKPADPDGGLPDFCEEWVLRDTVKRYSDFVAYPIRLELTRAGEDGEPVVSKNDQPLNSMKAIWTRPADELTEDALNEFYKHVTHDFADPLLHVSTKIEGTFEAHGLLYIPSKAPFDLYHRERAHRGIQLYVKRVFIMDECRELLPEWLRFVRGVVDAEDLSLNVSREILQQDRQIRAIRKHLVKKVTDTLKQLKSDDAEKYLAFWAEFGPVLKEGLLDFDEKKERILELVLAPSTHDETKLTSLGEYVERMPEDQESIYYMSGPDLNVLRRSPHLEAFREKGIEVLFFTDPVDEVWLQQMPPQFQEKPFKSIGRGEVDLDKDEEKEEAKSAREETEKKFEGLVQCLRSAIQDDVKEVRLSSRLTSSPSCLVLEEGDLSPQLEAMLRQAGQTIPERKPILELNPKHPLVEKLQAIFDANATDARLADHARLLYGQAVLAEGGQLKDPTAFGELVTRLALKAL